MNVVKLNVGSRFSQVHSIHCIFQNNSMTNLKDIYFRYNSRNPKSSQQPNLQSKMFMAQYTQHCVILKKFGSIVRRNENEEKKNKSITHPLPVCVDIHILFASFDVTVANKNIVRCLEMIASMDKTSPLFHREKKTHENIPHKVSTIK